jgi:hypothetical protein
VTEHLDEPEEREDVYEPFRTPEPTPDDELCACAGEPPLKLMTMRQVDGFNPIHCLDCNREVPPDGLALSQDLVDEIASWDREHGAIGTLELESGEYEEWATERLLDPASPTNVEGRELAQRLSMERRCYFWFFQSQVDEDWRPLTECPVCGDPLEPYDGGFFPQLLCEQDKIVVPGQA